MLDPPCNNQLLNTCRNVLYCANESVLACHVKLLYFSEGGIIILYCNQGATASSYLERTCSRRQGRRRSLWDTAWCGPAPGQRHWGRRRDGRSTRRQALIGRRPSSRCNHSYGWRTCPAPCARTSLFPSPPPRRLRTRRETPPANSTLPHLHIFIYLLANLIVWYKNSKKSARAWWKVHKTFDKRPLYKYSKTAHYNTCWNKCKKCTGQQPIIYNWLHMSHALLWNCVLWAVFKDFWRLRLGFKNTFLVNWAENSLCLRISNGNPCTRQLVGREDRQIPMINQCLFHMAHCRA